MSSPIVRLRTPRFRLSAEPFSVTTRDDVRLVGSRIGVADPAIVVCHGFGGWHAKPKYARLIESLAPRFSVYAFDLRGHGASGGWTTFGAADVADVAAVVARARENGHARVATLGASMGGIAVIRHAALEGGIDAVISVSAPARWDGHRSEAVRRMAWLTGTARGRSVGRLLGIRLPTEWDRTESPEEVVGKIAPVPLLVIHGRNDHYFEEEAWRLYRSAGEPKRLWLANRFGHAEDGFSPGLARRIGRFLYEVWGIPWPG
jgi:pimeloyl-ACP methyl ester carboxylesterase